MGSATTSGGRRVEPRARTSGRDEEFSWHGVIADDGPTSAPRAGRRWPAVATLAGLLVAGALVVSIDGDGDGDVDGDGAVTPATTVPTDVDTTLPTRSERPPVDAGLRYGGAGGGADIRAAAPIDEPLVGLDRAARLPEGVDVEWEAAIEFRRAAFGAGELARIVDLEVGDDTVTAVVDLVGRHLVVALDLDGRPRWRREITADSVVSVGVADGLLALAVDGWDDASIRWLDLVDGAEVAAEADERTGTARAALAARRRGSVELAPDAFDPARLVAGPGVDDITVGHVERVVAGDEVIRAVDEVAVDRLVLLAGFRLLSARSVDDSIVVDWSTPGVMLASTPSERGANLLVSNRRGNVQYVVDAATGDTITEVSGMPSGLDVYTPLADGMIVKRPALVGSSLAGIDLDGRERWRLLGSPPFAVGDGVLVTAARSPDGLVLSARR